MCKLKFGSAIRLMLLTLSNFGPYVSLHSKSQICSIFKLHHSTSHPLRVSFWSLVIPCHRWFPLLWLLTLCDLQRAPGENIPRCNQITAFPASESMGDHSATPRDAVNLLILVHEFHPVWLCHFAHASFLCRSPWPPAPAMLVSPWPSLSQGLRIFISPHLVHASHLYSCALPFIFISGCSC